MRSLGLHSPYPTAQDLLQAQLGPAFPDCTSSEALFENHTVGGFDHLTPGGCLAGRKDDRDLTHLVFRALSPGGLLGALTLVVALKLEAFPLLHMQGWIEVLEVGALPNGVFVEHFLANGLAVERADLEILAQLVRVR